MVCAVGQTTATAMAVTATIINKYLEVAVFGGMADW